MSLPPLLMGGRDASGRFVKGHQSLGGRPKGERNRLAECFYRDVYGLWQERGREALEILLNNDPVLFVRLVGASIPKDIAMELLSDGVEPCSNQLDLRVKLISPDTPTPDTCRSASKGSLDRIFESSCIE